MVEPANWRTLPAQITAFPLDPLHGGQAACPCAWRIAAGMRWGELARAPEGPRSTNSHRHCEPYGGRM